MKLTTDLLAGGFFSIFGGAAFVASIGYKLGTPAAMGPGFFPTMIAVGIMILGLSLVATAIVKSGFLERPERIHVKPLLLITLSVVSFAILQEEVGLLAALVGLILISAVAAGARRPLEIVAITVALVAIAYLIFITGLNIPFTMWAQ
ncbi:tripartite tricarboxylate transporter TctB family protein [Agrobacterium larrymoorei]|uniref:Tripartite tricarboxylate transporter TctB family protein n=1 Tax=Agrobacterium larrymoorei TaxID=160699 RepID=A0A4D7DWZ3_9HYPH|nr:tripartite tricarboxylate transporter TctB family protein [Agrobacterium larrymoorei]QCI99967.1 tripartite tricarboxylate transporter TctB family protein [Agrobacterium larrymoorei]QYA09592.1 tripartite tricarboxylate transporter TctB family protein [Agrobacterium larrymoorei]WHA42993.1 tripartite tricarboxylate transporter TctB family protein [Agrobacterium larrymoorei]